LEISICYIMSSLPLILSHSQNLVFVVVPTSTFVIFGTISMSECICIFIQDMFTRFSVVSMRETILGGNQWLSENSKLTWSVENGVGTRDQVQQPVRDDNQQPLDLGHVMLTPMQIRTFVAEIKPNSAWLSYRKLEHSRV